ncbi:MAG: DUF2244 domain-containing protein [Gammaproteobacteria bacterium]|nr:DUF2244 domain-containing protein [Gammaproteobacteria bacterium]
MITATVDPTRCATFVISPNQAPAWRDIRWFFIGMACTPFAVAISFAVMGFWPILPFAGIEVAALAAALYITAQRSEIREVVSVYRNHIEIERGRKTPEQHWEIQRAWAQVKLQRNGSPHYPSRLVIRSHGREIELGRFLVEEERCRLARQLRAAITATSGGCGGQ